MPPFEASRLASKLTSHDVTPKLLRSVEIYGSEREISKLGCIVSLFVSFKNFETAVSPKGLELEQFWKCFWGSSVKAILKVLHFSSFVFQICTLSSKGNAIYILFKIVSFIKDSIRPTWYFLKMNNLKLWRWPSLLSLGLLYLTQPNSCHFKGPLP